MIKSRLERNKEKLENRKKQTETELKNNPMLSVYDSEAEAEKKTLESGASSLVDISGL